MTESTNHLHQAAPLAVDASRLTVDAWEQPGMPYEPSNGIEGECFIQAWCANCERDKDMNGTCHDEGRDAEDDDWCPILGASFRGEAKEWQYDKDGQPCCIAFVPMGQRIPTPRCPHTQELPL